MNNSLELERLRDIIRNNYLTPETKLVNEFLDWGAVDETVRRTAQRSAADFVVKARAQAERSGLIDKFLQQYGLSTKEGVTLMRLAEALLRTPDATTANALIEDKIEAGDWSSHKGKSPFPMVNFSTRALMFTAAWLDDVEGNDPLRRMVAGTKNVLDRLGEPTIRTAVGQAMRIMGEHFVLGETIDSAIRRGEKFAQKGYAFSFDMLGEAAHTDADALKYFRDYEKAIAAIAAHATHDNTVENPGISVKLSALHPRYEITKKDRVLKELGDRVRKLAIDARDANIGFNIDAEEADRLDISLDLIESLVRDPALDGWSGFGVVVQAYQRRAGFVLDWLASLCREQNKRIMVRLVKGAYWDSEIKRAQTMGLESYPVFTRKALTDLSYVACAKKMLANTDVFFPQFATHNALTATLVNEMAGDYDDYELQRLHGMGEALHDSLLDVGIKSRIYAPVGGHRELLPYLVRRLLENGANSSFVNQLIDPDLSVDDVVVDPFDEVSDLSQIENPFIPAPRDHLRGERLAAKGWDETHVPTAAAMSPGERNELPFIEARPLVSFEFGDGTGVDCVNPANANDIVGKVFDGDSSVADKACEQAAAFAKQWAQTPAESRAGILRRAAENLEKKGAHFMRLALFEAGKTWPDAIAELREAVDFLRYYADQCTQLDAQPLGVVACISPWNFPLAIFLGQISGALAAGNCVVAKPAEQTPLIAYESIRLLHDAGIPKEALQFIPGDGQSIGGALTANPHVNGVVFTGSTEVAKTIRRSLIKAGKTEAALIAETGGINAMIVDSTALLEQAVQDTIDSAFQSAGQRCSACRVVCVQEDIADRFKEMLKGAMAELTIGDPSSLATDVGPVIDDEAKTGIAAALTDLESVGTKIAEVQITHHPDSDLFVAPTAYQLRSISDIQREIFGPVLLMITFKSSQLDDLIHAINALGFGLTLGIHTRIDETMERVSQLARVGNIYVNRNQIGAVVGVQPFGGEGLSGTGPKAGGPHYLKGMTKAPARHESNNSIEISTHNLDSETDSAVAELESIYARWSNERAKPEIFDAASYALEGTAKQCLHRSKEIFLRNFDETIDLPGPTGEANSLKLRGRGIALCLGENLTEQIATAIAAGNSVLCPATTDSQHLAEALATAGWRIIRTLPAAGLVSAKLLQDKRIDVVVFDGTANSRSMLAKVIAEGPGAIIPLLSSVDAPWRFAAERTLTINTTAAGGDVRLLSLTA